MSKGHQSGRKVLQKKGVRTEPKKQGQRDENTKRRLKMYTSKPDKAKMREQKAEPVRIEPDRKWFNNTRVVSQKNLEQYREALAKKADDPRSVLVKRTKLPVSLFDHSNESKQKRAANLLSVESYEETFSSGRRQKKPKLAVTGLEELAARAAESESTYVEEKLRKDASLIEDLKEEEVRIPVEAVMLKGTSKRIWGELYKVVDSSDIIIQVLDVRDPMGTRCYHLERHIKKDRPFKHVVLLLNKCDLVPTWVTDRWLQVLGKEYPTVAFKASVKHPFGKRALIGLLRQYSDMLKNRKHVAVGFIGYPNVGKSSVINTLRGQKTCTVAPVPGETKVWQYVALTSKVQLIDCPGVVAATSKREEEDDIKRILKGVVRPERIDTPEDYIDAIIDRVGRDKMNEHYKVPEDKRDYKDGEELLTILATQRGKLGKGGEPRIRPLAVQIIRDLQRGNLPYFVPPPDSSKIEKEGQKGEHDDAEEETLEGETVAEGEESDQATDAGDEEASDARESTD